MRTVFNGITDLHLELTHACNHACLFCPQCRTRATQLSPDAVFPLLARLPRVKTLILSGGEALLWPQADRLLDTLLASQPNLGIALVTNGSTFRERHFELAASGNFNTINISFNAATRETYKIMHGRDHFQRVVEAIERLHAIATALEHAGKKMELRVSCVFSNRNAAEIPGYAALFAGKVQKIVMQELMHYPQIDAFYQQYKIEPGQQDGLRRVFAALHGDLAATGTALRVLSRFPVALPDVPNTEQGETDAVACRQALSQLMISAYGDVILGCCNSRHMLGNLGRDGFEAIVEHPAAQALAAHVRRGNFEYCPRDRLRHKCPPAMAMDRQRRARPTVVVVFSKPLWPIEHGNQRRTTIMLRWLKQAGYRTVLVMPGAPDRAGPMPPELEGVIDACFFGGAFADAPAWDNRFATPRDRDAEKALAAFKDKIWCGDALRAAVVAACRQTTPVAVIANYMFMVPVFQAVPEGTLRIVDTHDVFSSQARKVAAHGVAAPLACAPEVERTALLAADVILAIQPEERELLAALVPERQVIVVGVAQDVRPPATTPPEARTALCVGSPNLPNRDGIRRFLRYVWPLVLKRRPDARLSIAGCLCDHLDARTPGVSLLGYREDLAPVYAQAALVINPTRVGTGLKVKSVEAIAHGKALVAWSSGLESLPREEPSPFVAVDSPEAFAAAMLRLFERPDERRVMEEAARSYAARHYDAQAVHGALRDVLEAHRADAAITDATTDGRACASGR